MADDKKKTVKGQAAKGQGGASTAQVPSVGATMPTLANGDSLRLGAEGDKLKNGALVLGLVGLGGAALVGGGPFGKQFQHSYLAAYMWGLSIGAGALWWVAIQHLVNARWSIVVRRVGELLAQSLLVMGALALPLLLPVLQGNDVLYPWAGHGFFEHHHHLAGKAGWFSTSFFFGRMFFYFGYFALAARYYLAVSRHQDTTNSDEGLTKRLQSASAPMLIGFALVVTFAAIDLMMTLDPVWFSTIFGVYYFASCVLTFHSMLALALMWLQSHGHLKKSVTEEHYHDIGKMMFAFICFWSYIGFSQFMLIWYANIPEESHWYHERFDGTWLNATLVLAALHFVVPFFGMMSRWMKRNPARLRFWSLYVLAVCWFDMYWLVAPNLHRGGMVLSAADFLAWAGVAGLVVAFTISRVRNVNLVPTGDPRLARSLAFENL